LLEAAGHRCVVVDLPGPDPSVDLDGYVALVVEAVRSARETPEPVVLVGQSFGGFSTSAAAAREPVDLLVLLNAMIPAPGESGAAWWTAVGLSGARREAEAAAGRDPQAPFDPLAVFFHDASDDLLAEAADQDRDESEASFRSVWPADAWPDVPTVVLAADDDRLFPPAFQRRLARERLGLGVTEVPGGHLNALTRPTELAEELMRIAASAGR
jgi:pimeloyl-ACP methyl ester carboxylesterase